MVANLEFNCFAEGESLQRMLVHAESGAISHPPPRRTHRGAGRGAAAAAIGILAPLLLSSGGCVSPVECNT